MQFLIILFALLSLPSMADPGLLKLLGQENIAPNVDNCTEEELALHKCVQDLCKTQAPPQFPVLIKENELYNFLSNQQLSEHIDSKKLEKIVNHIDQSISEMLSDLKKLEKSSKEELIKKIPLWNKRNFAKELIEKSCITQVNPKLPIEDRLSFKCDEALEKHQATKKYLADKKVLSYGDFMAGLHEGFYDMNEIEALMKPRLKELKPQLETLKQNTDDPEALKSISYMEANWGKYSSLSYVEKLKFIKGLSQISPPSPLNCSWTECIQLFDEHVASTAFKDSVTSLRSILEDPEFRETAIASAKIQMSLAGDILSEKEKKEFENLKKDTLLQVLNNQKKTMSKDSLLKYEKALNEIEIDYDAISESNLLKNEEIEYEPIEGGSESPATSEEEEKQFHFNSYALNVLVNNSNSYLFGSIGADLSAPITLISDHYIDPKYKEFEDPHFHKTNINVSLFSIKNPAYGRTILIHELGHHLSHMHERSELSPETTKSLTAAKECILSRYTQPLGQLYLEEEFADELSFTMDTKTSPLIFCPFLVAARPEELNLKFMKDSDNHQPDLWRELNRLSHRNGALPLSCKGEIKKEEKNYKYRKCL